MNVTLDDILKKMENGIKNFDKNKIMKQYKQKYENKLKKYILISPSNLIFNLAKGDRIRYSKGMTDKLSCVCLITGMEYVTEKPIKRLDKNNKIFDTIDKSTTHIKNITLTSLKYKQDIFWTIYPENYFFFKYIGKEKKNISTTKNNIVDEIINNITKSNKNNLNFDKLIEADPTIKNKIIKITPNFNSELKNNTNVETIKEMTKNDYTSQIKNVSIATKHIDSIMESSKISKKINKIKNINDAEKFMDEQIKKYNI
jgi:hypothetical protein